MSWKIAKERHEREQAIRWKEDGESKRLVIVSEPVATSVRSFGAVTIKYLLYAIVNKAVRRWLVSSRLFEELKAYESKVKTHALEVTRHGEPGDTETTYGVEAKPLTKAEKAQQRLLWVETSDEEVNEAK